MATAPVDTMISGSVGAERYEFPLRVKSTVSYSTQRVLSYEIRVGGHVHSVRNDDVCVFICVTAPPAPPHPEDAVMPRYDNRGEDAHKVANITYARYDKCCSAGATLHKGGGTAVMLRAACAYVLRIFHWVEWFSLTDTSSVTLSTGATVPLSSLSLSTHGATWYEREFRATIRDKAAHSKYRSLVESQLQTPAAKSNTIADLCSRARVEAPDACMQIAACYAGASTLQAFFCALKKSRSRDEYAQLIGHWVPPLLDSILERLHHKEWIVPAGSFDAQDFQVQASSSSNNVHRLCWHMPDCFPGCMHHPLEDI